MWDIYTLSRMVRGQNVGGQNASGQNAGQICIGRQNAGQFWGKVDKMTTLIYLTLISHISVTE